MMIPTDEKYLKDPQFAMLVNSMIAQVRNLNTSFSEIREAVLFAQLKYELENPRVISFSPNLIAEIEFRTKKN